ncbi:MAG TPA: hypothetical protein VFN31_00735 [Candidatus Saccharimonadales bacterium]|nr:hypothetical protein [Candidatus Saccharimonadales bacterium]
MNSKNQYQPVPIFELRNFIFYGATPEHIESRPHIENYVGAYGIFEVLPNSHATTFLASDIPNEATAVIIAYARINYLQKIKQSAGAIGSVIIMNPDMTEIRVSEEEIIGE